MPGLRRSTPRRLILELTERLAEDYDSIPLPEVTRVVQEAVATTTGPDGRLDATGQGIPALIAVVEHLAREELDELRRGASVATVRPARGGRARPGSRRNAPRRGAG